MEAAQGKYLGVVDSDDYVDLNFYETLYEIADRTAADIIKGIRHEIDARGNVVHDDINSAVKKHKMNFSYQFQSAIYKSTIIHKNGIKFPEGISNSPDIVFLAKAVFFASSIETTEQAIYWYAIRANSATTQRFGKPHIIASLNAFEAIIDFINSVDIEKSYYDFMFLRRMYFTVCLAGRNQDKDCIREIAERALKFYGKYKFDRRLLTIHPPGAQAFLEHKDMDGLCGYLARYALFLRIKRLVLRCLPACAAAPLRCAWRRLNRKGV
jgi:hypothetical protein